MLGLGMLGLALVVAGLVRSASSPIATLTLPLPLEPAPHPRLRAIARVPRGHGAKDAVDFGTLPTASSQVVTNRLVDSGLVAKLLAEQKGRRQAGNPVKLGFSF
jgi:hypothetical protein